MFPDFHNLREIRKLIKINDNVSLEHMTRATEYQIYTIVCIKVCVHLSDAIPEYTTVCIKVCVSGYTRIQVQKHTFMSAHALCT